MRIFRWYYRTFVFVNQSDQSQMNIRNDYLKFLELHAGPEYPFYYRCAYLNMVSIICIFFGPAFPHLYFIGLISVFNFYIMERLTLTYFFRIPPKFNESLTLQIISNISWIPIFSLMLSFWMYTNVQMFSNTIDEVDSQSQITYSHHMLTTMKWKNLNQP